MKKELNNNNKSIENTTTKDKNMSNKSINTKKVSTIEKKKPSNVKSKSVNSKSVNSKPVNSKPVNSKPVNSKPVNLKPVNLKNVSPIEIKKPNDVSSIEIKKSNDVSSKEIKTSNNLNLNNENLFDNKNIKTKEIEKNLSRAKEEIKKEVDPFLRKTRIHSIIENLGGTDNILSVFSEKEKLVLDLKNNSYVRRTSFEKMGIFGSSFLFTEKFLKIKFGPESSILEKEIKKSLRSKIKIPRIPDVKVIQKNKRNLTTDYYRALKFKDISASKEKQSFNTWLKGENVGQLLDLNRYISGKNKKIFNISIEETKKERIYEISIEKNENYDHFINLKSKIDKLISNSSDYEKLNGESKTLWFVNKVVYGKLSNNKYIRVPKYLNEVTLETNFSSINIIIKKEITRLNGVMDKLNTDESLFNLGEIFKNLPESSKLEFIKNEFNTLIPSEIVKKNKKDLRFKTLLESSYKQENETVGLFEEDTLLILFEVDKQSFIYDDIQRISQGDPSSFIDILDPRVNRTFSIESWSDDFTSNDIVHFMDLDIYQQRAVKLAEDQDYSIIHGPPGTGKTQTLTGIALNNLYKGTKTLVSSQSKTALEVFYKRLISVEPAFSTFTINLSFNKQKNQVDSGRKEENFYSQFIPMKNLIMEPDNDIDLEIEKTLDEKVIELESTIAKKQNTLLASSAVELDLSVLADSPFIYIQDKKVSIEKPANKVKRKMFLNSRKQIEKIFETTNMETFFGTIVNQTKANKDEIVLKRLVREYAEAQKEFSFKKNINILLFEQKKKIQHLYEQYPEEIDNIFKKMRSNTRMAPDKFIKENTEILQKIFSIIVGVPEDVSALMELKRDIFEHVIIDEASQMYLEDAIPLLYRSKKATLVGDTEQLSPQLIKERLVVETDDDLFTEPSVLSHYDKVINVNGIKLMAHYRSSNAKMLEFSNYWFYENQLKLLSNPLYKGEITITPINVLGEEEKGINEKELDTAFDIFVEKAIKNPQSSIGTILPNEKSVEYFIEKIRTLDFNKKKNIRLKKHWFKDINSIQGMEAETIIFVLGFNPSDKKYGVFSTTDGDKYLNVAITRAIHEMIVVKSLIGKEIKLPKSTDKNTLLFKEWIVYVDEFSKEAAKEEKGSIETFDLIRNNTNQEHENKFKTDLLKILKQHLPAQYTVDKNIKDGSYLLDIVISNNSNYEMVIQTTANEYNDNFVWTKRENTIFLPKFISARGWKYKRIWYSMFVSNPIGVYFEILKTLNRELYTSFNQEFNLYDFYEKLDAIKRIGFGNQQSEIQRLNDSYNKWLNSSSVQELLEKSKSSKLSDEVADLVLDFDETHKVEERTREISRAILEKENKKMFDEKTKTSNPTVKKVAAKKVEDKKATSTTAVKKAAPKKEVTPTVTAKKVEDKKATSTTAVKKAAPKKEVTPTVTAKKVEDKKDTSTTAVKKAAPKKVAAKKATSTTAVKKAAPKKVTPTVTAKKATSTTAVKKAAPKKVTPTVTAKKVEAKKKATATSKNVEAYPSNDVLKILEATQEIEKVIKNSSVVVDSTKVNKLPVRADLKKLSITELKKEASKLGATGYSSLNKEELVDLVFKSYRKK